MAEISNPYLHCARTHGLDYGAVLKYSDTLDLIEKEGWERYDRHFANVWATAAGQELGLDIDARTHIYNTWKSEQDRRRAARAKQSRRLTEADGPHAYPPLGPTPLDDADTSRL